MGEVGLTLIIYGTPGTVEKTSICFPIPILIAFTASDLERTLSLDPMSVNTSLKRYFILLLENTNDDTAGFYTKMQENSQVAAIFQRLNHGMVPKYKQEKLYYVPNEVLTLVVTSGIIQFLKREAEKQLKRKQISLVKVYLNRAKAMNYWLMSNLRVSRTTSLLSTHLDLLTG